MISNFLIWYADMLMLMSTLFLLIWLVSAWSDKCSKSRKQKIELNLNYEIIQIFKSKVPPQQKLAHPNAKIWDVYLTLFALIMCTLWVDLEC